MGQDEQFHPDALQSIRAGLQQLETDQIEFENPAVAVDRLGALWQVKQVFRSALAEKVARYVTREPNWYVGITDEFRKNTRDIDRKLQGRILQAIHDIITRPTVPRGNTVKPLTGELKGLWRYRIGNYRLVNRPDTGNRQVVLVTFVSRGRAYV